jgi:hypothetical protein
VAEISMCNDERGRKEEIKIKPDGEEKEGIS